LSALIATDFSPRSLLYLRLAEFFSFPTSDQMAAYAEGRWQSDVDLCAISLGIEAPRLDDLEDDPMDFESEFIALFEVGLGGAPCPLHSGHYARDRMRVMEEVLRFYRFFGYQPDTNADRFPDHARFELEFMAHLGQLYEEALSAGEDVHSLELAQRDFITRNLVSWLPPFCSKVEEKSSLPFTGEVVRFISGFIEYDAAALCELAASVTEEDD